MAFVESCSLTGGMGGDYTSCARAIKQAEANFVSTSS